MKVVIIISDKNSMFIPRVSLLAFRVVPEGKQAHSPMISLTGPHHQYLPFTLLSSKRRGKSVINERVLLGQGWVHGEGRPAGAPVFESYPW